MKISFLYIGTTPRQHLSHSLSDAVNQFLFCNHSIFNVSSFKVASVTANEEKPWIFRLLAILPNQSKMEAIKDHIIQSPLTGLLAKGSRQLLSGKRNIMRSRLRKKESNVATGVVCESITSPKLLVNVSCSLLYW